MLGELASTSAVSRISVPRLTSDAVEALAAPHGADGRAVYELTQGNAFYVTEVLATGAEELPATVRDAVFARAAMLPPSSRSLLDVASLVPARAELWLLERVAGDAFAELDACVASGMLRQRADGIEFRHELARLAVESAVAPARRRTLHGTILAALASPPGRRAGRRSARSSRRRGRRRACSPPHARAAGARARGIRGRAAAPRGSLRLGARPAAKLVRQTLRTRGAAVPRGPRLATRSNPAELTSRELYTATVADTTGNTCIAESGVSGMGLHLLNPNLLDTTIDPAKPEALVYRPQKNGTLRLAALEYIVFKQAWEDAKGANAAAPSLFGRPFLLTPAPNRFGIPSFYALHAWAWKKNPTGTFQPWKPEGALSVTAKEGRPPIGRPSRHPRR